MVIAFASGGNVRAALADLENFFDAGGGGGVSGVPVAAVLDRTSQKARLIDHYGQVTGRYQR